MSLIWFVPIKASTSGSLELRRLENCLDRFLLGRINKAARIYDYSIRLFRVACNLITTLFEMSHHHLAINEVFGTTKTYASNFFHHNLDQLLITRPIRALLPGRPTPD